MTTTGVNGDRAARRPARVAGRLRPPTSSPVEPEAVNPTLDRLKAIAGVVAPGTVIAALMYYFGYVTSYARYAYFGIDLSTLHMSVQDLAMQSVAALYVPLAALLAAGLVAHLVHGATERLLGSGRFARTLRWAGRVVSLLGVALVVRAVVGLLDPELAATEPIGSTPAALGLGPLLIAWGHHITAGAADGGGTGPGDGDRARVRIGWLLVAGIGVLSLFWITNSVAGAYGRGEAIRISTNLDVRPAVTLDTTERLYLAAPGVAETALPELPDQKLRYRYTGLRLLVESDRTLFLIPLRWSEGAAVAVVPRGDSIRLTFSP